MPRKEKVTTREYTYTAVFEPAEEGGYIVSFPALPGCATQGETLDEAGDGGRCAPGILGGPGRPRPSGPVRAAADKAVPGTHESCAQGRISGRLPQLSYRKVAKALQRAGLVLDHATDPCYWSR